MLAGTSVNSRSFLGKQRRDAKHCLTKSLQGQAASSPKC